MIDRKWTTQLMLILGTLAALALPTASRADWFGWCKGDDCPRSLYSPWHYWAPACYYHGDVLHPCGKKLPDQNVPSTAPYTKAVFPCPGVDQKTLFQVMPYGNMGK